MNDIIEKLKEMKGFGYTHVSSGKLNKTIDEVIKRTEQLQAELNTKTTALEKIVQKIYNVKPVSESLKIAEQALKSPNPTSKQSLQVESEVKDG